MRRYATISFNSSFVGRLSSGSKFPRVSQAQPRLPTDVRFCFFVIGTPGLLKKYPSNYITSFHLAPGREKLLAELVTQFPAITIIDVTSLMQQIREIISRGSLAVQYVFFFTLGAGLLMLYAGIQANREHRRQESAILRTLGLKRRGLLIAAWVEFSTLGLLAGTLASACARKRQDTHHLHKHDLVMAVLLLPAGPAKKKHIYCFSRLYATEP